MNITVQLLFEITPVSLRKAWDINLACRPTWLSPILPSISALGTSAATESIIIISTAELLTRESHIPKACSPVSGCEIIRLSVSTPKFLA